MTSRYPEAWRTSDRATNPKFLMGVRWNPEREGTEMWLWGSQCWTPTHGRPGDSSCDVIVSYADTQDEPMDPEHATRAIPEEVA